MPKQRKNKANGMEMDEETLLKKLDIDVFSEFVNGVLPDFPFIYGNYLVTPKEKDGKKIYNVKRLIR